MHELQTGIVEHVLTGGEGIVSCGQENIRIHDVVAGDHIAFQITQKRRGVMRGKLIEVLKPSQHRVPAPCPVADACGGCALQAMNTTTQSSLKTHWVNQAFQAIIQPSSTVVPLQPQPHSHAGRRRVRWHVQNNKLGFLKRTSHQVIPSSICMALIPNLDTLRNHIEQFLPHFPVNIQSIQAIALHNGIHLILESEQDMPPSFEAPQINMGMIQWWWRKLKTPSITPINKPIQHLYDVIQLNPYKNNNIGIQIGPNDFIQGHQAGNQTLISQILAWTKNSKRVVDLFSGCGNLSLPIAAAFGAAIIGAEVNVLSVKAANANAQRLGLNARYETLDLFSNFAIEPFVSADTLIIDPPRTGAKRICKIIAQFFPQQIIMVSCDIASGARDAKALQDAGFKLDTLRPLDLFPYTGHVEVISLWTT